MGLFMKIYWFGSLLLVCLLLTVPCGCRGDDDDSAVGDDDDSASGDDDDSAPPEFSTVINVTLLAVNYASGSSAWHAGEQVQIELEIENAGPLDAFNYPQFRLSAAAAPGAVNPPAAEETFFGVSMENPMNWFFTFEADESAAAQIVEFSSVVVPMNPECGEDEYSPCYENEPLVFEVAIE
jgi:hypothetical protein